MFTPMPKFCSECGTKLINDNMKFCSECGAPVVTAPVTAPILQEIKEPVSPGRPPQIEQKPVSETSRLSGLAIEKYLIPNEVINFRTKGSLYVGGEAGLRGYVTNNRVIFYTSLGLIIKKDRLHEIPLKDISQFKIVETGLLIKEMYLQLNNLKIKGDRSDILDLYRTIQIAKQGMK
jgi:hypothetical protein